MEATPSESSRRLGTLLMALVVIVVGQGGAALRLFGPMDGVAALDDEAPILSGRHPLHLYHGSLGAATFRERYGTSCYDPSFQAGCPKTPVFDGGCRPAELFLLVGDPDHPARAYKRGFFLVCLAAPLAFMAAARGAGMCLPGTCLAGVGGCLVWWSPPVRALLDAGSLDHLIAGLAGLVFIGGLSRYSTEPGLGSWFIIALSAMIGWFAHPVLWFGLVGLVAIVYLVEAPRHGLAWHLGLLGAGAAGLAPNLFWLSEWVRFWWLRRPTVDDLAPFPSAQLFFGDLHDYLSMFGPGPLGLAIAVIGMLGLFSQACTSGRRLSAYILLASVFLAIVAARLGKTWPPLQIFAADRVAPFAVSVLVLPAAGAIARAWADSQLGRMAFWGVVGLPLLLGWGPRGIVQALPIVTKLEPISLGLDAQQRKLVDALIELTSTDGRILIEENDVSRAGWNWTALLPTLTGRAYLGGLDPNAWVEHSFCGLRNDRLNGREFREWTRDEMSDFSRRYNVGWVLCRSARVIDWWATAPGAKEVARFSEGGEELVLFSIDRRLSYALSGSARVVQADRRRIVLDDVVPNENGEVVLSFHHQQGLRVTPATIPITEDKDLFDPIPMIKLHLHEPATRIVLSWDNP